MEIGKIQFINRDGLTFASHTKAIPVYGLDANGEAVETGPRIIFRWTNLDLTPDEYEEIDGVLPVAIVLID